MIKTSLPEAKLSRIREHFRIAAPSGADKAAWLDMWNDYAGRNDVPPPEVLEKTWQRLHSEGSNVGGLFIYDRKSNDFAGFLHYILHPSTWHTGQSCYVEDGYILPVYRPRGAMLALYDGLIAKAREENWNELYWMTRSGNTVARKFYDRIAQDTDWVRYVYDLKDGP